MTGELSPEEAARYVERLQRELSAGRRDLVARSHSQSRRPPAVRVRPDEGSGTLYEEVTTGACDDVSELQATLHHYAEHVWFVAVPGRTLGGRKEVIRLHVNGV